MSKISILETPVSLADLELVLSWVDTYKLSRTTKKIHRDFADGVLLAEILSVHYPKLIEMHNYPPRNAHSLKVNNWMTLNRKALRKLKLGLTNDMMEQLASAVPGLIERVLFSGKKVLTNTEQCADTSTRKQDIEVREKILHDEEINKSNKESEQNNSSGGSYYEAMENEDYVMVVPVKNRVNGVLEIVQQKVVNYGAYLTTKEELKDVKETVNILKQKLQHLENLLKLKEERIDELQRQLDRKVSRRNEVEVVQNSLSVPFDTSASSSPRPDDAQVALNKLLTPTVPTPKMTKSLDDMTSKIPLPKILETRLSRKSSKISLTKSREFRYGEGEYETTESKSDDLFEDSEAPGDDFQIAEFKNPEQLKDEANIITIEDTIQRELKDITNSIES
ncbi:Sperm flagellar protein 1 [Eumeta japonica]|uniref:Sperm flagellar protein 1 n=1 Tax=Eumeta variegata TaxID=151549 RepID=A0A4C1TYX5_EUMVA|nr:Sperm flagellar protein 1 [Eumeta japonica]